MKKEHLHSLGNIFPILAIVLSILLLAAACKKDTHQPPPQPPAHGVLSSLADYGSCSYYPVHGLFYNGIPGTADSNYVEVSINVTTPGSYNIISDKQNGVTFSAQGTFSDTGMHDVRLRSSGTFINITATDFTVSFDSSHCTFRVWVQDSAGLSMADNSWQFTAQGHVYKGTGSALEHDYPSDINANLTFFGSLEGFSDTSLTIYTHAEGSFDTTLNYPTSQSSASFNFITPASYSGGAVKYAANSNTVPAVVNIHPKSLTIVFLPDAGGISREVIIFRFSGTVRDADNNIIPITDGVYKAVNPRSMYL